MSVLSHLLTFNDDMWPAQDLKTAGRANWTQKPTRVVSY